MFIFLASLCFQIEKVFSLFWNLEIISEFVYKVTVQKPGNPFTIERKIYEVLWNLSKFKPERMLDRPLTHFNKKIWSHWCLHMTDAFGDVVRYHNIRKSFTAFITKTLPNTILGSLGLCKHFGEIAFQTRMCNGQTWNKSIGITHSEQMFSKNVHFMNVVEKTTYYKGG